MARKLAFAKVIGTGTEDDPWTVDVQGSAWQRLGMTEIGGHGPSAMWDIVVLADPDVATGDQLMRLPDWVSLDTTIGEIPANKRSQIQNWLRGRGYDTAWITLQTTLRDFFVDIASHLAHRPVDIGHIRAWILERGS